MTEQACVFKVRTGPSTFTDFTSYISVGGYSWSRNDIDASSAGRDMRGNMRRKRVSTKVKLQVACRTLTATELFSLNSALSPETVVVQYLDPRYAQLQEKTFYGSEVNAAVMQSRDGVTAWSGVSFSLTEV